MNVNEIWAVLEPYVFGLLGALGGGGIIYWIVRALIERWIKNNQISSLGEKFAENIVGKTINIDITALVAERINALEARLGSIIKNELYSAEEINRKLADIIADVGEVFSRSKTLTLAEKERLVNDISLIRGGREQKNESTGTITVELGKTDAGVKSLINYD